MTCPTCDRLPSERHRIGDGSQINCPDPIHDLADQAPALLEALELADRALDLRKQYEARSPSAHATLDPWTVTAAERKARAAILAAKGGE